MQLTPEQRAARDAWRGEVVSAAKGLGDDPFTIRDVWHAIHGWNKGRTNIDLRNSGEMRTIRYALLAGGARVVGRKGRKTPLYSFGGGECDGTTAGTITE